jgi:predicted PurR-regulated permease PerM
LLAILAGLFTFVPYAGPIAAALPIALVAITEGTGSLALALGGYTVVQSLEGFVITPLVQQRAVALPPALVLAAEVALGLLAGAAGVILSVPLAAAVLVFVRMVYVEGFLERDAARTSGA